MAYDCDVIEYYLEMIRNNKTAGTKISERQTTNIKARERYHENSEKHKRAMKRWRDKNKERIRKYSAEYRSKETPEQRKNRLDYMKKWRQKRKNIGGCVCVNL